MGVMICLKPHQETVKHFLPFVGVVSCNLDSVSNNNNDNNKKKVTWTPVRTSPSDLKKQRLSNETEEATFV